MPTMADMLDILWQHASDALFISKDEFVRNLADWEIVGHDIDGKLAFISVTKGPEFHFESVKAGRALPMSRMRAFLQPIIDQYGYAETRTPKTDEYAKQHRFNKLFGFKQTSEDEYDVFYRIEKLRHA